MGDRANVVVRETYPDDLNTREAVFLYSHWGGTELPETLRKALDAGRGRWSDDPYLARIIFDAMIGDSQGEETGYGISTRIGDNEYDLLVLYKQHIVIMPEDHYHEHGFNPDNLGELPKITFEDYCEAPERTWANLTDTPTPA